MTISTTIAPDGTRLAFDLTDYTEPWSSRPAQTIVLHHGAWRNMNFFQTWVPLLGARYRVLRLDARGSGASGKDGHDFSIQRFAADALAVMDHLEIADAHWIGESSGGMVGLAIASKDPQRLRSLVLCNTPIKRKKTIGSAYTLGELDQATALAKHGVRGFCERTMKFRIDMTRATPGMVAWILDEMERTSAQAAISLHKDIGRQDFTETLSTCPVPTMMLVSGASKISGEEQVEQIKNISDRIRIELFKDIGHGLNLFEPQWCTDRVLDFVTALDAA